MESLLQIIFNWSARAFCLPDCPVRVSKRSLIVGIILVYLSRTNRTHLVRFVWGGVAAAVALSLGVAIALERFNISEDGFEGLLLLVAAFFVVTMILWMNRIARHLKKEIEDKVESYAAKAGSAAGWGLGPSFS
jgi:FTR1 family protein